MNNFEHNWIEKYVVNLKKYKKLDIPAIQTEISYIYFIADKEGKKYAAKSLKKQASNECKYLFSREIQILLHVQHPTIISIKGFSFLDINCDNNITFLMKYMKKGSLSDLFRNEGNMKCNNTQKQIILLGISFGMMLLHKHHIVNRDLKPENVLLYKNYKPCLTDFNLSKSFDLMGSLKKSMPIFGTLYYIAPEIFKDNNYNYKIDVYSFGILMNEIVSGVRVYHDIKMMNPISFLESVVEGKRPELNDDIRNENYGLAHMIDLCLLNDPNDRPTFREIFKKLSSLPNDYFTKYEQLFPFLKDDGKDKLNSSYSYAFQDVKIDEIKSYVDELLNSLHEEKTVDEIKFNETKEICQQIFTLTINDLKIPEKLDDATKIFLQNLLFFFPIDSDVKKLSESIESYTFDEFYDKFLFPIIRNNLNKMIREIKLIEIEEICNIFSLYSFFSAISFSLHILKQQQKIDFLVILEILNQIIRKAQNSLYCEISAKLFVNIIKLGLEEDKIDDFEKILVEMTIFYSNDLDLPKGSDKIIPIMAQKMNFSGNELNTHTKTFIHLVANILTSHPKVITQEAVISLIKTANKSIIQLNETCLDLFLTSAKYINTNQLIILLNGIMNQILDKYYENDFIESNDIIKQKIQVNQSFQINHSKGFHPPIDLYQLDKIKLPDFSTCFKVPELESFIRIEVMAKIAIVEQIVVSREGIAQYFIFYAINELQIFENKNKNTIFYQKCALFFYLISKILKKFNNMAIQSSIELGTLFKSKKIFDPTITYFDQNYSSEIIFSLRKFIIHLFAQKNPNILNQILQKNCFYPYLFQELVYHLLFFENNQQTSYFCSITDTLIACLVNYRINSKIDNLTDDNNTCLILRKTIFSILKQSFLDDSNLQKIFKSQIFINYFCILLMEPPIRSALIETLFHYFKILNLTDDINFICQKIVKLIKVCFNEIPQKDSILIYDSIMNLFIKSMISNDLLISKFEPITSDLCNILININIVSSSSEEIISNIIFLFLDFLFEIYKIKQVKIRDSLQIESLINHFYPKLNKRKTIEKLIQIIGNIKDPIISPNFEIQQPILLCSLVNIFIKTNYIYNILQFISKLCKYSSLNIYKCHECEFDLFILNTIIEWENGKYKLVPKDETCEKISENKKMIEFSDDNITIIERKEGLIINQEIVDLLLHLFAQIASTVSSIPVVHKYFSMIVSSDSLYLKSIINSLNDIFAFSKYSILAPLPLSSLNITISNIPNSSLHNGFCFIFWFFRSPSSENILTNIVQIFDGKKQSFMICKKDNFLQIHIASEAINEICKFELNIPYKTWTMLSINLIHNFQNKQSEVTLYLNQQEVQKSTINALFLPEINVKCIINNSINNESEKCTDPDLIGLFMLTTPIMQEQINEIVNGGQRSQSFYSCVNEIIFAYKPQYGENISLLTIVKNGQISENYSQIIPFMKSLSFYDSIFYHHELNILVLFFEQLFKVEYTFQSIEEIQVDFLINLFNLGIEFEQSFYNSDCLNSLVHFLFSLDNSKITFELYQNYFKLFEALSDFKLKKQFIDLILMNYNLWLNCPINILQKILKNWDENLYLLNKEIIDSIRFPEWFIFIVCNQFNSKDPNDQNYLSCRKSLYSIIRDSFKRNLTINHIKLFISRILIKPTLYKVKDILDFLLSILSDTQITNAKINFDDVILPLSKIFTLDIIDDEIILKLIFHFILIYGKIDFKPCISFYALMQYVILLIPTNLGYLISKFTFNHLISLLNNRKKVELLPLLSISAIYGDLDYINSYLEDIDTNLDFYVSEDSIIYPVLLIFKYSTKDILIYRKLILKIILFFRFHLIQLIETINIIGFSCFSSEKFDEIKHDVLLLILISNNYTNDEVISLINIINNFIFFRLEKSKPALFKLFLKSPFCENDQRIESNDSYLDDFGNDMKNDCKFLKKIRSNIITAIKSISLNENHEIMKKFGLRLKDSFDNDISNWYDFDLANENINLFEIIKSQKINISKITIDMNFLSDFIYNYTDFDSDNVHSKKLKNKYYIDLESNLTKIKETKAKYQVLINDNKENTYSFGKKIIELYRSNLNAISSIDIQLCNIFDQYYEEIKLKKKELTSKNSDAWKNTRCYLNICNNSQPETNKRLKRSNLFGGSNYPFKIIASSHKKGKQIENIENEKLEKLEKFICTEITINEEKEAFFQINNQSIYITTIKNNKTKEINSNEIKTILYAYRNGKYSGFQIFTKQGTYFYLIFDFESFKNFVDLFTYMESIDRAIIQNTISKAFLISLHITNLWLDGRISNFEYLMNLNILSGRSFNDIDQYPVFPWILSDYESKELDLKSPSIYRDLSKPIGACNEQRLKELINQGQLHLYDSFYSNRFSVCFWLSHIEPFCSKRQNIGESELEYASNEFTSINDSYKDATTKKNDFRELIPEFFYLPEFLNDVSLPVWANQSVFEFIYLHRKALESEYVSSHLNEWIDLIWGYKQDKIDAVNANNVFSYELYERKIDSNIGQLPVKLFDEKHPVKRFYVKKSSIPSLNELKIKHFNINFDDVSSLLNANVSIQNEKTGFSFKLIDSNCRIYIYSVDFSTINSKKLILATKNIKNIELSENSKVISPKFIDSNRICFIDNNREELKIIDCQNLSQENLNREKFEIISFDTNQTGWIVIGTNDSRIILYNAFLSNTSLFSSLSSSSNLFTSSSLMLILDTISLSSSNKLTNSQSKFENYKCQSFSSFKGVVICSAISSTFHIFVCGTKENFLLFYELNLIRTNVDRIVKTNGRPQKIIITSSFGFVLVLLTKIKKGVIIQKLVLYSVNGDKIRSRKIKNNIIEMTKALSFPGKFDYIIAADDKNRIFVFEAFYLNIGEPIMVCKSKIIKLVYLKEENLIFAFCEDGTVTVIDYPIIE